MLSFLYVFSCHSSPVWSSKIDKPNVPLRPIVSFVQSPRYQLSKHIPDLLSPLVGLSPSAVHNSMEFVQFIVSQTPSDDEVVVSLDMVSLFTNIPTASV